MTLEGYNSRRYGLPANFPTQNRASRKPHSGIRTLSTISASDAFLLLNKWMEEQHPLRLLVVGEGFRISINGRIEDIAGSKLSFLSESPGRDEDLCFLELSDSTFAYGDSREAPPDTSSTLEFSALLTILRPDGAAFIFGERRL